MVALLKAAIRGPSPWWTGRAKLIKSAGDFAVPIFPRSAIKAFQFVPVIESGAVDHFGLTDEEIALACSSHNGEPEHVRVARSMLQKAQNNEELYECGAHWPSNLEAQHDAVRAGGKALQVHNNCSGKHAGMLALARQLGANAKDYVKIDHPVQQAIAEAIARYCDVDVKALTWGIDGCSVPTWAFPLSNMALGFARLTETAAGKRIIEAVRKHPFMVAGTKRFDTQSHAGRAPRLCEDRSRRRLLRLHSPCPHRRSAQMRRWRKPRRRNRHGFSPGLA